MELRHLQSFLAVYAHGSFRRAAEAEHLAQPAVSRHVQRLERELGTVLFERLATGAVPTAAGRTFHGRVEPPLRQLLLAVDTSRSGRRLDSVRVGYIAPAIGFVGRLAEAARALDPEAELQLAESTSAGVADGLRSRRFDIGFLITEAVDDDLTVTPVAELRYRLVVSRTHPLGRRRVLDLADLDGHILITIASREPTHDRILSAVRQHAPNVKVQRAFGYNEVHGLVVSGLGVAAVPPLGGRASGGVTLLRPRPELPGAVLAVATRRGWRSPWTDLLVTLADTAVPGEGPRRPATASAPHR